MKGGCQMVRACFEPHPKKTGYLTNSKLFGLWQERLNWREKSRQGGMKSAESRRKNNQDNKFGSCKGGSRVVEPPYQPKGNSSSSSSSSIKTLGARGLKAQGIEARELESDSALMAWLTTNGPRVGLDPDNHGVQRRVFVLASYALSAGTAPGGLFRR